jgi:catechol 2,3-dioxygenase-like lactoylglutathione lyase family enzyme
MIESPLSKFASAHLRIARPTDRLEEVVAFYKTVLGFTELGRFEDHHGYDGVMLGHVGMGYHLEFTHSRDHQVGTAPMQENLLVFYFPDLLQWQAVTAYIEDQKILPVPSCNPYWDRNGRTYEDPDGYRIVIQNAAWNS